MTAKKQEPPANLTRAECDECLKTIKKHSAEAIALFEIRADELFENFNHTAKVTISAMEATAREKTEQHFENQGKKEDVAFEAHIDKQDMKYSVYLERSDKRENRRDQISILILTLFAMVIGYSYLRMDSMKEKFDTSQEIMKDDLDEKVDRKEAVTLNEIKLLTETGDQYERNVFVRKEFVTADTSAYYYAKINIYGSQLRGAHSNFYKNDYNKAKGAAQ